MSIPTRKTEKQAALDAMVEELLIGHVRRHILLCKRHSSTPSKT